MHTLKNTNDVWKKNCQWLKLRELNCLNYCFNAKHSLFNNWNFLKHFLNYRQFGKEIPTDKLLSTQLTYTERKRSTSVSNKNRMKKNQTARNWTYNQFKLLLLWLLPENYSQKKYRIDIWCGSQPSPALLLLLRGMRFFVAFFIHTYTYSTTGRVLSRCFRRKKNNKR